MKKPVIDYEECIGCGSCAEICPEVFEVRDEAKAYVIGDNKCGGCDCRQFLHFDMSFLFLIFCLI